MAWTLYQKNRLLTSLPDPDYLSLQNIPESLVIKPTSGPGSSRDIRIGIEWLNASGIRVYGGGNATIAPLQINLSASPILVIRAAKNIEVDSYDTSVSFPHRGSDAVAFQVVSAMASPAGVVAYNFWINIG